MTSNYQYYLGIDGGGSKCRALLMSLEGEICGTGLAGAANIARNFDTSIDSIMAASLQAVNEAGLSASDFANIRVGAGLAGASLESAGALLRKWQHPFHSLVFTSDLHIACLGAHEGKDGAVLIVGTGSCAAKLYNGQLIQHGGHGFLLGDKGSGAWTGKQAIQLILEQLDGLGDFAEFGQSVMAFLKVNSLSELLEKMNYANPREFAHLAPLVVEMGKAGNKDALAILQKGSAYLSQLCRYVINADPIRLGLIGGLSTPISPWLDNDIRALLTQAKQSPEWGAIHFAKQTNLQ